MLPGAEAIFARAQQVWAQRVVPPYISFRIACEQTFLSDDCTPGEIVAFTVRTADGRSFAQSVPDANAPAKVLLAGGYVTGPDGTPLGFYRVLPERPGETQPSPPPNLAPDPLLTTIATGTAVGHTYAVTYVGKEQIGAYICDHLALRPLVNSPRYALRALWVDEASGNVVRLIYAHDFGNGKWGTVEYRFGPRGEQQIWTIVRIEAEAPNGELFGPHGQHVASDLDDISFPASMPETDFEQTP